MFQYFAHNNNLCIGLSFFFLTTHSNRFCLDHWTNVKAILKICPSSCLLASFWQQSHIYCIWKNKGTALAECDIETRCNQKEKPTQIRHPLLHFQSWILSQSQMDTEFFFFSLQKMLLRSSTCNVGLLNQVACNSPLVLIHIAYITTLQITILKSGIKKIVTCFKMNEARVWHGTNTVVLMHCLCLQQANKKTMHRGIVSRAGIFWHPLAVSTEHCMRNIHISTRRKRSSFHVWTICTYSIFALSTMRNKARACSG